MEGKTSMLILTRRLGETLMIGDDVTVTVLGIKGNQVRLGTDAPKEVQVHREEIYQRIQMEKAGKGDLDPTPVTIPEPEAEPEPVAATVKPRVKKPKITNKHPRTAEADGNAVPELAEVDGNY